MFKRRREILLNNKQSKKEKDRDRKEYNCITTCQVKVKTKKKESGKKMEHEKPKCTYWL